MAGILRRQDLELVETQLADLGRRREISERDRELAEKRCEELQAQIVQLGAQRTELEVELDGLGHAMSAADGSDQDADRQIAGLRKALDEHYRAVAASLGKDGADAYARFERYCEKRGGNNRLGSYAYRRWIKGYLAIFDDAARARSEAAYVCRVLGVRDIPSPRSNVLVFSQRPGAQAKV